MYVLRKRDLPIYLESCLLVTIVATNSDLRSTAEAFLCAISLLLRLSSGK